MVFMWRCLEPSTVSGILMLEEDCDKSKKDNIEKNKKYTDLNRR